MKKLFATQDSIGLLVLRLFVGITFTVHGADKLFGAFGGRGISDFAGVLASLGLPHPTLQAYLAGGSEFFGGLFLVLGFLTRLAALPPMAVMLVAIFKVHWPHGFFIQKGGFEYPFVVCGALVALLALGGGMFSVDRKLSAP